LIFIYRVALFDILEPKKWLCLTFWNPKFFLLMTPSLGVIFCAHSRIMKMLSWFMKNWIFKRKLSFSSFSCKLLSRSNFLRESDFEMRNIIFMNRESFYALKTCAIAFSHKITPRKWFLEKWPFLLQNFNFFPESESGKHFSGFGNARNRFLA
jgi:hypothetical protein